MPSHLPNKILRFVEAESGPWSAHLTGDLDTPSPDGSQVVTERCSLVIKFSFRLSQGEHHRIGSLGLGIQFPVFGGAALKGDGCSTRGIYVGAGSLCYFESGGGCS